MKKPRLLVTDHAIVRYLERVGGFDIEGLRRSIGRRCDTAHEAGATSVLIEGHAFLIVDGHVVTVLDGGEMLNRKPRARA